MGRSTEPAVFPGKVFCDTSFFYACLDPRDANHEAARKAVESAVAAHSVMFCTWDIISETATLLRYRSSFATARRFLMEVKPGLKVVVPDEEAHRKAEKLFLKYGDSRRLSICDAVSCVVVKDHLNDIPCLTFDGDFKKMGLTTEHI
jgi:predicted nucleic acid-binding protein